MEDENISAQRTENYYVAERSKLLKSLQKNARVMRKVSDRMSGKEFTDEAVEEALEEYEDLIPQIPYIGGRRNRLTGNLVRAAEALSMYRVVKRYG